MPLGFPFVRSFKEEAPSPPWLIKAHLEKLLSVCCFRWRLFCCRRSYEIYVETVLRVSGIYNSFESNESTQRIFQSADRDPRFPPACGGRLVALRLVKQCHLDAFAVLVKNSFTFAVAVAVAVAVILYYTVVYHIISYHIVSYRISYHYNMSIVSIVCQAPAPASDAVKALIKTLGLSVDVQEVDFKASPCVTVSTKHTLTGLTSHVSATTWMGCIRLLSQQVKSAGLWGNSTEEEALVEAWMETATTVIIPILVPEGM